MRMTTGLLTGAAALALVQIAMAADAAPKTEAAAAPTVIGCGKTIAADATEESLKKQFGAENIVYKDIGGPEGTELNGTIVFEKDPKKMLAIVWADEAKRAKPSNIRIDAISNDEGTTITPPDYVSPEGIHPGMTIEEIEKLNGKPFKLSGFGWDYGGNVTSWEGGKLDMAENATCGTAVTFTQLGPDFPEGTQGDIELMSNDKKLAASHVVVFEMNIWYMQPDLPAAP